MRIIMRCIKLKHPATTSSTLKELAVEHVIPSFVTGSQLFYALNIYLLRLLHRPLGLPATTVRGLVNATLLMEQMYLPVMPVFLLHFPRCRTPEYRAGFFILHFRLAQHYHSTIQKRFFKGFNIAAQQNANRQ